MMQEGLQPFHAAELYLLAAYTTTLLHDTQCNSMYSWRSVPENGLFRLAQHWKVHISKAQTLKKNGENTSKHIFFSWSCWSYTLSVIPTI